MSERPEGFVLSDGDRAQLESDLGYRFRDPGLLDQALTHASYSNETSAGSLADYDRLEFLGDAVIGLLLAENEFRSNPEASSGVLSEGRARLARRASLAAAGERLGLGQRVRLSAGERDHGGTSRRRLLADVFEAVTGAVYLDGGIDPAREFLRRTLIDAASAPGGRTVRDSKSALQELAQAQGRPAPAYVVLAQEGPPHAPSFLVQVEIAGSVCGQGVGGSKREAEQEAARVALIGLGEQAR